MTRELLNKNGEDIKRIYSLDVLKILATATIVLYHFQQVSGIGLANAIDFSTKVFNVAYLVEFFFVLSGFWAYKEYDKLVNAENSYKNFLINKFNRLIPPIILPCVLYTVLCYLFRSIVGNGGWYFDTTVDIIGTILASFGLQFWGVFDTTPINYPLWYVDVLLLCFIVFCLIIWISKKFSFSPIVGFVAMIIVGMIVWNREIELPFLTMHIARGYYAFFFGLLVGMWYEKKKEELDKIPIMLLLAVIIVLSLFVTLHWIDWFKQYDHYVYTFVTYPAIIALFLNSRIQKLFNFKFLGEAGKVTYDVYVWHLVVFFFFDFICSTNAVNQVFACHNIMVISILSSIIVGLLSFYLSDKATLKILGRVKKMFV